MAWLQLYIDASKRRGELESALEQLGALAVTLRDGADNPVYEPGPGETRLWPDTELCALFPETTEPSLLRQTLRARLKLETLPNHRFELLAERDWERAWLDDFRPMQFGRHLWILPQDHPADELDQDAVIIRLDPGLAFGTGTHPTTALCLSWLDAHPPRNLEVIDFGCGSGVLALAAARLGAARVLATDNDPQALAATRENARRNGLDSHIECLEPGALPDTPVDLVLANILAAPLLALRTRLTALTRPAGRLILSGMLEAQSADISHAYAGAFSFAARQSDAGWSLLEGRRQPVEAA